MSHKRLPRPGATHASHGRAAQRGYSLIELSVAMVIALFLLGGFLTVLQGTRKTSTNQNLLAQLQDSERIAMTMISGVVESSGYYPNAETARIEDELKATSVFATVGQVVAGGPNATAALGDTLSVRYNAAPGEDVIDCSGKPNTSGSEVKSENQFSIQQPNAAEPPYLACSLDNGVTFVRLVNNVQKLEIFYGVNTSAVVANSTSGAVDAYLKWDKMKPLYWTNVYSIKVVLTFVNPLYRINGQPPTAGQQPTITFSRVIGVMSRVGVDVVNFI
jgi:type IV pilus assembly protein PilW